MQPNLVVFYQEPAPYFTENIRLFCRKFGYTIHIFHYPLSPNAPFTLKSDAQLIFYNIQSLSFRGFRTLIKQIKPDAIFLTTWRSPMYLFEVVFGHCQVVLGIDNISKGGIKESIFSMLFRLVLKARIRRLWVPGRRQVNFGKLLGFLNENISLGAYCCEFERYNPLAKYSIHFTPRLIFAGRYVKEKGLLELLNAFEKVSPKGWELICIGTGPLKDGLKEIPGVKHLGFVQPNDLPEVMRGGGIFVLPSHFEPWGVVVHEFASAGFPLLLSDQVGAAETFLEEGVNGFLFSHAKEGDLEEKIRQMTSMPIAQLKEMSRKSNEFAQRITPEKWGETLMNLLNFS
jgi:glycosyltransferase involved in cell wall biosynthesis